jgi:ribonuclease-3
MGLFDSIKSAFGGRRKQAPTSNYDEVQSLVGYHFRDIKLLELALTHRSYVRCVDNTQPSNERLEFLGDSVLGLVIANQLYHDYGSKTEGDLTKFKAMLVNEATLASIGRRIGLNNHIRLSPEERKSGGNDRASISSDTFESVIGAVFLDGGYESAKDVVLRLIYVRREKIVHDEAQQNYKGDLLELIQARGEGMPRYEVISEEGPDHEKIFHVVVNVNGTGRGEGVGFSKKEAEQKAACEALGNYRNNTTTD